MFKTTVNHHEAHAPSVSGKFELVTPKKISKVEVSCGCSTPSFNEYEINYVVALTPPSQNIPKQLYDKGKTSYDKNVHIVAHFEDQTPPQELLVKVTVHEYQFDELSY